MGDSPTAWAAPPRQKTPSESKTRFAPSHACGSGTTLTHPSAGATGRRRKNSHSRATLQQNSHSEVHTFTATPKSVPFCGVQFAPLHSNWSRHPDSSVVRCMRENASRSPLPCSAAPCWETTLMMLSQSLGSRLREKTPHSRMFKKIVQREAGGRNVSGSGVRVSRRTALGDHPSFPTPEEDAPLLSQLPTPIVNAPLLM